MPVRPPDITNKPRAAAHRRPYTCRMDEQQSKRGGVGRILWILVLRAIVVLWWYFRPEGHAGASLATEQTDAYQAPTEPDEILVDLRDDATPAMIAAIERDTGVKLALVDD